VCALLALFAASSLAAPGSYCSKEDLESYKSIAKAEIAATAKGDVGNLLAAVEALALLKAPVTGTEKLCEKASNALDGDVASVAAALRLKAVLKCPSTKISESAMTIIDEGLGKTAEPLTQLYAVLSSASLQGKGVEKSKIDEAVKDLLEHLTNDGFKAHEDMDTGSGFMTGRLLLAISQLKSILSDELKNSVAATVIESVKPYLSSSAVQDDSTLSYPHYDVSVDDYISTAALLKGVIEFNKAFEKKLGFNDEKLNKMARFFLSKAHIANVHDVLGVLTGLNALNSGTWRKPLIVSASQTTLKASAKGDEALVRFQVTDVFGHPATKLPKLFLVSLTSSESTTALINNQELTSSETGHFEFNLLAIKPAPGNYKLSLSVTPAKVEEGTQPYAAVKTTTRFVKVISSIEISDLSLTVRKSKENDESTKHTYTLGKKGADLELKDSDHLEFSFSVKTKSSNKPVTVQQAFLLLSSATLDSEVFFVAKYDTAKKLYTASVPLSRHVARFGAGGAFSLKLLVGDSYIDNSISWDVCKANIKLTEGSDDRIAKAKLDGSFLKSASSPALKDASTLPISYKPQILHKFRPADKRADPLISRTFTLIVLAPLALFIIAVLFTGLNFGACPSGLGMIFSLAFHALIGVHVYIIALFFLQNNLFQTLGLLCYSVPPTIFVGHQALKAIAHKRAQLLTDAAASKPSAVN